jgi:hypothetical protein
VQQSDQQRAMKFHLWTMAAPSPRHLPPNWALGCAGGKRQRSWQAKRQERAPLTTDALIYPFSIFADVLIKFVESETALTTANDLAIRRALETAGMEFIDENGGMGNELDLLVIGNSYLRKEPRSAVLPYPDTAGEPYDDPYDWP